MTKKPHVHAEVIKAWAMGETIEYRAPDSSEWKTASLPAWIEDYEYRVRPNMEDVRAAVTKMHEGYQYGAGYYNQDSFIEGLKGLFAMFGLRTEDEECF